MKTNTFMPQTAETYSAPEINVVIIAVEQGLATSYPGGDVEPLMND